MSREYTDKLIELVDKGLISQGAVLIMCLKYISEADVRNMMEINEVIGQEE